MGETNQNTGELQGYQNPFKSRGVWGSVIAMAVTLLLAAGYISEDQGQLLQENGPEIIVSLIGAVSAFVGIIGRLFAKGKIVETEVRDNG